MQTLRLAVLTGLLLALSALTAHAQQIQTGTAFFFEHSAEDRADTEKYQICVDGVVASCQDVAVLKSGAGDWYTFTLPAFVARGNHAIQIRAVGFGEFGASGLSNAVNARVIGKPGPPVNLTTTAPAP